MRIRPDLLPVRRLPHFAENQFCRSGSVSHAQAFGFECRPGHFQRSRFVFCASHFSGSCGSWPGSFAEPCPYVAFIEIQLMDRPKTLPVATSCRCTSWPCCSSMASSASMISAAYVLFRRPYLTMPINSRLISICLFLASQSRIALLVTFILLLFENVDVVVSDPQYE